MCHLEAPYSVGTICHRVYGQMECTKPSRYLYLSSGMCEPEADRILEPGLENDFLRSYSIWRAGGIVGD